MMKRSLFGFNVFLFISTFARTLVETFIALFLFKSGVSMELIIGFYVFENVSALLVSYIFVRIGEAYNYTVPLCVGVVGFVAFQFMLGNLENTFLYIALAAFLYAVYRRGYWVARRYYVTEIMPRRESSGPYSIMVVVVEIASIVAGILGGLWLDNSNVVTLWVVSSVLLIISAIPLLRIKGKGSGVKIQLIKNLKRYKMENYLAFSLYELNNAVTFFFPVYIFLYVQGNYTLTGIASALSSLATILFVLFYGKIIRKRNHFVLSSALFAVVCVVRLFVVDYWFLVICFVAGLLKRAQQQSLGKIYFENRMGMDVTHYSLIYQLVESFARIIVVAPLFLVSDIRVVIGVVLVAILIELVLYTVLKKKSNEVEA